jgi:type I restriction enzyme R subunit
VLSPTVDDFDKLAAIHWKDATAIRTAITLKIPKLIASDQAYQNARKHSDPENIRIEAELAVQRAIAVILSDYIELFQQFTQNADFKEQLTSFVLRINRSEL